ncbi:MAG: recombination mediator RecR [Victivallaceae bacterium]|nr:recombination mediator RecR [Victivallaceae bacterium]
MKAGYPDEIERLIGYFRGLPGVGRRGAERIVMHLMSRDSAELRGFGELLAAIPERIGRCPECGSLSEAGSLCRVCADETRDRSLLCVVETMAQMFSVESSGRYFGRYFVLGGKLDPLSNATGSNMNISGLLEQAGRPGTKEIILALGFDVESRATCVYLEGLLKDLNVKLTRPALGLPAGSNLTFADAQTIAAALEGRK